MQVLVADDDAIQREVMTAMLQSHGREVVAVTDGLRAWETLQNNPEIDLIFTDWMMPKLSGPELIRKIRSSLPGRYIYIILCTGRSSRADLIEGMRSGADDFLAKPIHEDELLVRMSSGERIMQLEKRLEEDNRKLAEANKSLSQAYERIRLDLDAAAQMQRNLLPASASIHGVHFESLFCPASTVAGDIFNFFPLTSQTIGFYILDVSGHGIPAAMLSVTLSKMLAAGPLSSTPLKRRLSTPPGYEIVPPNHAISELNRRFQGNGDMYLTMVYGTIDAQSRQLSLSQAGHPCPIYLRKGARALALGHGGFPVGILPEMDYELTHQQTNSGDRLFLCSDGILECFNRNGEQFGTQRLMEFLEKNQELPLKHVLERLKHTLHAWVDSKEFEDDLSLVALEVE